MEPAIAPEIIFEVGLISFFVLVELGVGVAEVVLGSSTGTGSGLGVTMLSSVGADEDGSDEVLDSTVDVVDSLVDGSDVEVSFSSSVDVVSGSLLVEVLVGVELVVISALVIRVWVGVGVGVGVCG